MRREGGKEGGKEGGRERGRKGGDGGTVDANSIRKSQNVIEVTSCTSDMRV